ncbi:TPM domain-containing protein [Phenylobacterium sp. SCN 70-31]|uniref:TPM domain-containing protein n=1 Tax=Phenylobacterium sp. SCN 70-31 TaxID=1660129 RepID=UPI00086F2B0A|nr:TPM domain-containing protein [Phenylobacterium sp. SCN 70-31]ODT89472.1 MAG: methanol dehydrogenase [Phenylobacterium sp. SCN 70-31]
MDVRSALALPRRFAFSAALVALLLLIPVLAFAAPNFPPLTGRVVDEAKLLSPATETKLSDELAALEAQTGHQVVVATVPDLQGYEIEEYGYQLLRAWGIGRAKEDDGVILLVAPAERKVRIEVGYGLEPVLTDALSSVIIRREILPAFKAGDFEKGIVDGAGAIVRQIGLPSDEAQAAVAQAAAEQQAAGDEGGGGLVVALFVIFVVFWLLSGVMRAFGGRKRFGGHGLWWLLPLILSNSSHRGGRGSGWSGGGGGGWSGGGGFSGGGGSGGGGGASGSW